jgi:predicted RNA-binding protein (virulence factor B family)
MSIGLGRYHDLTVTRMVGFGAYLDAGELGEVLLPSQYVPAGLAVGDSLRVFLYLDSEARPVATTRRPRVQVGEFAYLSVVANTEVGAFLDWGLEKDLLVPFAEQHLPMRVGQSYLVYVYIDDVDGRIVASSKIDKFLDDLAPHGFRAGQAVNLIIATSTELGFKAIIDHSHWGLLYKNEVFERLSFGQSIRGYIKQVRPDGRIDLSLQGGSETRDRYERIIEDYLRAHDGFAPVHDKSDPLLIEKMFGMSKKAFKKAIGGLYKQRRISIEADGIQLLE